MTGAPTTQPEPLTTGSKVWGVIGGVAFLATGLFMYLPARLVAPTYGVVLLWVVWLLLAAAGIVLIRARRPGKLVLLAIASALLWFAVMGVGDVALDWSA